MTGKDTDRSPMVRIDAHRPWRGELLEREPPRGSLHRGAYTHPHFELAIRQGLRAREVGRCENRATTLGRGEAGSRRRVGNGECESLNDAQTGRLAGKEVVRPQSTVGHLPEPARTRLPV